MIWRCILQKSPPNVWIPTKGQFRFERTALLPSITHSMTNPSSSRMETKWEMRAAGSSSGSISRYRRARISLVRSWTRSSNSAPPKLFDGFPRCGRRGALQFRRERLHRLRSRGIGRGWAVRGARGVLHRLRDQPRPTKFAERLRNGRSGLLPSRCVRVRHRHGRTTDEQAKDSKRCAIHVKKNKFNLNR